METRVQMNNLYDYYKVLLTEKQREYFEQYFFDNLTLAEIAQNLDVSRNAVHKQLKEVEEKLLFYEEKLNLWEKRKKIEAMIESLDERIKEQIIELI